MVLPELVLPVPVVPEVPVVPVVVEPVLPDVDGEVDMSPPLVPVVLLPDMPAAGDAVPELEVPPLAVVAPLDMPVLGVLLEVVPLEPLPDDDAPD